MSETTGLKKLLYKTLKHEKDYTSPASSACLFSYYTTEEIRMNVYLKIIDNNDITRIISFYFNDNCFSGNFTITDVIPKLFKSDIDATYDLYNYTTNTDNPITFRSLYINYDKIKKITACLEILSGNIYELNFERSKPDINDNKIFATQGLFRTDAVNATMLNRPDNPTVEFWTDDDIYNTNMMFSYKPFQIHNEYLSDYTGIRFGSGSKKIDNDNDGKNETESGNSYINIYTGDDKDPIYVTQYNGENKPANQITLLDRDGNTRFNNDNVIIKNDGDTLFFNPSNDTGKDTVAILNGNTKYNYKAGVYLRDTSTPEGGNNAFMTVDGKIYAKSEIKTDGNINIYNISKKNNDAYYKDYIRINAGEIELLKDGLSSIVLGNTSYTDNVYGTDEFGKTFYGGKIELFNHNNDKNYYNSNYKNILLDSSTGCIEIGDNTGEACVKINSFMNNDGKHGRIRIFNNGSDCIEINGSDGTVTATSFNASSDKRLKKNIVDYIPQKSILDLPIKEFDYITTEKHAIGCLAQDLQEICPEIVDTDEKGYLSIQESKIVYLLLDEVKKLRKELDELKGRE